MVCEECGKKMEMSEELKTALTEMRAAFAEYPEFRGALSPDPQCAP